MDDLPDRLGDGGNMGGRTARSRWVVLAVLAAVMAVVAPAKAAEAAQPNIVVITTDDQDLASLSSVTMPNVTRLLQERGTTFTDYVVSGPLCCPARAVFLTGQYGHNNGVTWNIPGYADLRNKANTLPVWLRQAGYRTAHVGKYLHWYERAVSDPNQPAPGWDEWHTFIPILGYYDYTLRVNGRAVRYGDRPEDYLTRVLNRTALGLVRHYVPRRKPLFLAVDQFAPHAGPPSDPRCPNTAVPDPRDRDLFQMKALPRTPSFNEVDVSDKPSYTSTRPSLRQPAIDEITRRHRCRLASLRAVDRGVRQIYRALRAEGELRTTVFIFTSDNGWFEGQHRIPMNKWRPYEEAIRVPLIVRAPNRVIGRAPAKRIGRGVANVDLAPTILRLARARPCTGSGRCRTLDGRSLLPLLRGNRTVWPRDRGVLLELEVPSQQAANYTSCDFEGIRTRRRVYLEHHSFTSAGHGPLLACQPAEETELYNLRDDPFQLRNLSPAPPSSAEGVREAALAARLARLKDCAGVAGRDPRPPSGAFCE